MRKVLASILACAVFASIMLVGCKQRQNATDSSEPELGREESAAAEDISSQETDAAVEVTEHVPGTGLRNPATYRPQDRGYNFLETADFYYYLYNGRIFFSEKETPSFYYLCSKPNCRHTGEDCNAYGGGAGGALGYWDDKLYNAGFVNDELALVRMDLDGSNHELVTKLAVPVAANGTAGGSYSLHFANGYLYYFVIASPKAFFRTELATGRTEQLFQELLADGTGIMEYLRFDGEFLYFIRIDPDGSEKLCRAALPNQTVEELLDWSERLPTWDVRDSILYYYDSESGTFYEYALNTHTTVKQVPADLGNGNVYYDAEHVYLLTWREFPPKDKEFFVFDREYRCLYQMSLHNWAEYLYAADGRLFFSDYTGRKITNYLLLADLGKENAELHPVKDPYALR